MAPDSVAMIDPESGLVVADVPVGARPETVAADERFLWVANIADGTVQQIDMGKRRVVATISPDLGVEALAVGRGLGLDRRQPARLAPCAWTPAWGRSRTRWRCRPRRRPAITSGTRAAAALGGGALWVASTQLAAVLRVDTATRRVVGRIDVGNDPAGLAVGAGAVWVADSSDNTVNRIVRRGRRGDGHDPARQRAGPDRGRRGRDLGREPPRRHGVADRSRHALGQGRDPGRPAPVRYRGRRRRGLGGQQPLGDRVAHRPAHEPRHEDDRPRGGAPVR